MSKFDVDAFYKTIALADTGKLAPAIATELKKPYRTVRSWLASREHFTGLAAKLAAPQPKASEIVTSDDPSLTIGMLKQTIKEMKARLARDAQQDVTAEFIKQKILGLKEEADKLVIPDWLVNPAKKPHSTPGVATLFASDWHWGERVFSSQIAGKNRYNLEIANQRAVRLVEQAIDLLENHTVNPIYPGIVLALGGDMVSGGIHEELMATDEQEIMPIVLDILRVLVWAIRTLAEKYGHVFVPCVSGNHGRSTHKIRAKGRNFTSFDWLIYQFLKMKFEGDARVTFFVPDGSDALYRIYGHRYLLTHGDQFRGGDGMIGALGPIIRGDHKKRSRNAQIGLEYDTMLMGHWHQYIHLQRLIVNGSLKGYDEYAYQNNFGYERARQALWFTHPKHGITFAMPVYVDDNANAVNDATWVSIPEAA